jgi:pimeloyl-ACP methyl ester carboxylesterase
MGFVAPALEAETGSVEVAGHRVELWRKGSGRPLLLLHPGDGFGPHLPLAHRLAESFDVIAPSHPGFGNTAIIPQVKTVDDLSYFYLDLMDRLDIDDCLVAGLSFGGWLAVEIATKTTARMAGLVLSAPLGFKFGEPTRREILDLFSYPQYELEQWFYADAARARRDYANFPDPYLEQLARNHESFARYGWSPTLFNPKLADRAHRVNVPTLLVWGEEDRVVGLDYARALAGRLPQARLETIPGAGHYVHLEKQDAFIAALTAHAGRLPG